MGEFVRTETDGGVATIRIDRPPANALARPVSLELSEAAGAVADDDAIGAVVVWGGETIFAAGADIKAMVGYGPDEIASDVGALEQACRDLEAIPKITIAAINGFALGGGLEVALACDFRYAAQDAQLGLPEIKLGIIPGSGGTQTSPAPRRLGTSPRPDLHGTPRPRQRGARHRPGRWGFARGRRVHASPITEHPLFAAGPMNAYAAAKRALAAADRPLAEGLAVEREAFVPLFATRDQEEGMRAFLEKREPRFGGR